MTDNRGGTATTTRSVTVSVPTTAIAFRGAANSNANGTTSTVTVPAAVQAGDALVLTATVNADTVTVSDPAGWTRIDRSSTTGIQTVVWSQGRDRGRRRRRGLGDPRRDREDQPHRRGLVRDERDHAGRLGHRRRRHHGEDGAHHAGRDRGDAGQLGRLLLGGQVVLDDRVDGAGRAERPQRLDRRVQRPDHLTADRRRRGGAARCRPAG